MRNILTLLVLCVLSLGAVYAQQADKVKAGTLISISAKGIPSEEITLISGAYSVDKSGTINMPYLNTPLRVVGMTGRQVETLISSAYKKAEIFTSPIFVVSMSTDDATLRTDYVQVGGYVAGRRNVPYRQELTLIAAIIDAGDITDFGSRYIQVTRNGKTETYDYFSVRDRNLKLQAGDQIYVPNRGITEGRPNKLIP